MINIIKIIDAIYPPACGICGKLDKNWLCNKCKIRIKKQAICKIEDYKQTTSYFDKHIYIFQYDGIIRDLILNYKFNQKNYIYNIFVNFLKNNEKIYLQIKKYDIMIPVPISKKRLKQRGYNQSAVFARSLAKSLKMEYKEDVLIKTKDNKQQSSLKQEERTKNVENVYKVKNAKGIFNKKILLIDDVFTTGSTVNECARILKQFKAKEVGVLTIAKD